MSKELIEKKNDLIKRAEDVLNDAKAEKRELTEAEAAELAEIRDDVKKILDTLQLEDDFRKLDGMEEKKEEVTTEDGGTEMTEEEKQKEIEVTEKRAFENYIRNQALGIETRTGEGTPDSNSAGALIPTTIVNYIIKKVYDICPILERSQKFNVKGNLDVPFYPADSNNITVAYQDEFSSLSSSSAKFDTVTLKGYLAGALTLVSRSLINNTDIDIVGFVVDEMAYQIKRFVEHELLIGTPADTTTDPVTPAKVLGMSTLENLVTAASASAITADEVVKVHDAIKDEFQPNAMWVMSPATRTALRTLKDGMGRYLLQDDVSLPFGSSLLGKPVYVSDNMPNIATKNHVIYYGDFKGLATKFSEEMNVEVLRERYADQHAYGVIGCIDFDVQISNEQRLAGVKRAQR